LADTNLHISHQGCINDFIADPDELGHNHPPSLCAVSQLHLPGGHNHATISDTTHYRICRSPPRSLPARVGFLLVAYCSTDLRTFKALPKRSHRRVSPWLINDG